MIVVDKKLKLIRSSNKLIPEDGKIKVDSILTIDSKILIGDLFQLIVLFDETNQSLRKKASLKREDFNKKIQLENGSEVILTYNNNGIYHSAIISNAKLESGLSDKKQRLINRLSE